MHVRFRSRSELDDHLACGAKDDTFEYVSEDRVVTLHNDCRRYPLRLEMDLSDVLDQNAKEEILYAFVKRVRSSFDASFSPYVGASLRAQIAGLAVKLVVFFSLGRVEVVFRKGATREARRRVIGWLLGGASEGMTRGHPSSPPHSSLRCDGGAETSEPVRLVS